MKCVLSMLLILSCIVTFAQPQILVFEGDSNTAGAGTTSGNSYPSQTLQKLGGNYLLSNLGIGGQTSADMLANSPTNYPGIVGANSIFVLLAGINDIQQHRDGVSINNNVQQIIDYVQSLGCTRIVVGTYPTYAGILPTDNANRLLANQLIRNNAAANGYFVADHATLPQMSVWSGQYWFDYIHWTNEGAGIVAENTKNAILNFGSNGSCNADRTAPRLLTKNITIYLDGNGKATIQPADVIESLTDNCAIDNASIRLSRSEFTCADLSNKNYQQAPVTNYQAYSTSGTEGNQAWLGEQGMEFRVDNPHGIVVKQLGAFDHQLNGINGLQSGGIRVAIYEKITRMIVPGLEAVIAGMADGLQGNHRIKNIAPVTLQPGSYVLVAKGYHGGELNGNRNVGGQTAYEMNGGNGAVTFIQSLYGADNSLGFSYPQYSYASSPNIFLAGSFIYSVKTAEAGNVIVSAQDVSGNIINANANISVEDTIAPAIVNVPDNVLVSGTAGVCSKSVTWTSPLATDNCSQTVQVFSTHQPGFTFPKGTTKVMYTFTDVNGNSSHASFTVTVNCGETSSPLVAIVDQMTDASCGVGTGSASVNVSGGTPPYTYEWNSTPIQNTRSAINLVPGKYSVTVTDAAGHQATAHVNIRSTDNTPPVIPSTFTLYLDQQGKRKIMPSDIAPLILDNCAVDLASITVAENSFTCQPVLSSDEANEGAKSVTQAYSTNNNFGNQRWQGELGMEFSVEHPSGIIISQLGAFDDKGDGISGAISGGVRVAIFDKNTRTIVSGLDELIFGHGDGFSGSHRLKNVAPVKLMPGSYVIVAKGYNVNELNGNRLIPGLGSSGADLDNGKNGIRFLKSMYSDDNPAGFAFPVHSYVPSPNVFIAGTFVFEKVSGSGGNGNSSKTVSVTASDINGNTSQANVAVVVRDTTAPIIVPKNNVSIQLDETGNAVINPQDVVQSISDNCLVEFVTVSPNAFNCSSVLVSEVDPAPTTVDAPSTVVSSAKHQAYTAPVSLGNQAWKGEMGMEFVVNDMRGIVIRQLGAFDHEGNGISGLQNGGVRVAIFNKDTRNIVPGLDEVIIGMGDAYSGNHRMKNITPVTLMPGHYVLVAKGYCNSEMNGNLNAGGHAGYALDGGGGALTFIQSLYSDDHAGGFGYPVYDYAPSPNVFLAGTFTYEKAGVSIDPMPTSGGVFQAYTASQTEGNQAWKGEMGMEFSVVHPNGVTIRQLGAFDHKGNGVTGLQNGGIRVAIYNKATRTIVTGLDEIIKGNADEYKQGHRMKNILPVKLMPGNYVVVAKGYGGNELNGNYNAGGHSPYSINNGNGTLDFVQSYYSDDNAAGFNFPSYAYAQSPNVFLAGTFTYVTEGAIIAPEEPVEVANGLNYVTITAKDIHGNTSQMVVGVTILKSAGCNIVSKVAETRISIETNKPLAPIVERTRIYPNPTTGQFSLEIAGLQVPDVTIQLINQDGKVLEQRRETIAGKSAVIIPYNLGQRGSGIYYLKINSIFGTKTVRVVVQR